MKNKSIRITLCLLIFAFSGLSAKEKLIICVRNPNIEPYESAITGFKRYLSSENTPLNFIERSPDTVTSSEIASADLIFTLGSFSTKTVSEKTNLTPIVFTMVIDPKFTAQNITGVIMDVPLEEQLSVLSRINPTPKRIGIIYDHAKSAKLIQSYIDVCKNRSFEIHTKQVSDVGEVYSAVRALRPSIDCLLIIPDTTVYTVKSTEDILLYCLREGLPAVGISPTYVKAGALFSVSCNYERLGYQSGTIAGKILRGESPSEIAYIMPDRYDLSINLIVAQRIGITFQNSLRKEATNVIK